MPYFPRRPNVLKTAFEQSLQNKLTKATNATEKRKMIEETNPLFYVLTPTKGAK